jgi:NarL family two-component system response regulator LiaR
MTVDDHEIVRSGMEFLLMPFEDMEVVGKARSGEEALHLCQELQPDVILMDMVMPEMDGPAITQAVRQQYPDVQVLALTTFPDEELVQRVMHAGAIGYLLKGVPVDQLADAIRAAHAGQPTMAMEAVQALVKASQPTPQFGDDLSKREREVLALLAEGRSNAEITEQLMISISTVKFHVSKILEKLDASSRTEAVTLAIKHNLTST